LLIHELPTYASCTSYVLTLPTRHNDWEQLNWVAWAGSALLHADTLQSFREFLIASFSDPAIVDLLGTKAVTKPTLGDMTLWYLFLVASRPEFRKMHRVPVAAAKSLPHVKGADICSMGCLGTFDERDGDLDSAFQWLTPGFSSRGTLQTVHFQGVRKRDLVALVQTGQYARRPLLSRRSAAAALLVLVAAALAVACLSEAFRRHVQPGAVPMSVVGAVVLGIVLLACRLRTQSDSRKFD